MADHYETVADLPETIAVFPLTGALLFPRWTLPLNIFEPRYLNMVDDAMSGGRLVGMVQTTGGERSSPDLAKIGCVGRITSYSETNDGRYLISLSGLCRFRVVEELEVVTPYRQVRVDWSSFAGDFSPPSKEDLPLRTVMISALKNYTQRNQMEVDWQAVDNAPMETLINALSAGCPFTSIEKQALLEAETVRERADTLIALLEMDLPGDDNATIQ